jgi:hypothetical protein
LHPFKWVLWGTELADCLNKIHAARLLKWERWPSHLTWHPRGTPNSKLPSAGFGESHPSLWLIHHHHPLSFHLLECWELPVGEPQCQKRHHLNSTNNNKPVMIFFFFFLATVFLPSTLCDYVEYTIYSSSDCTTSVQGKYVTFMSSYTTCSPMGTSTWGKIVCTTGSSATLNEYSNAQCSGTPTTTSPYAPLLFLCRSGMMGSCMTGDFSFPSSGVYSSSYST